ncbi:SDR family oxidoreductase [Phytohabitans flavus]|uniref:Short-chain dehydrogenase n=1 Tax=Phytohabitans flavus TaxID=1076124 RepID=A0A6F8XM50_9ACTN|nr:SDR family oxidoreductase [Phytohabitans flavus]BCB74868.1 short-chain dehydrogenase [Phytohabitans flavus]
MREHIGTGDGMANDAITGSTAVVTGASRGFGRVIGAALAEAGARVVGVARDGAPLAELQARYGDQFTPVAADAADPVVAGKLIDEHRPRIVVLSAGANPLARPLHQHTWETFSRTWEVDVQQAFNWSREALLAPLEPGSTVVAVSSGAALRGSPLSGGYAGAKATVRFIAAYAAEESAREGLGIRFIALLPQLTAATDLGRDGVAAYARRAGVDVARFVERSGFTLTPDQVAKSVLDLASDPSFDKVAYLVTPAGTNPVN